MQRIPLRRVLRPKPSATRRLGSHQLRLQHVAHVRSICLRRIFHHNRNRLVHMRSGVRHARQRRARKSRQLLRLACNLLSCARICQTQTRNAKIRCLPNCQSMAFARQNVGLIGFEHRIHIHQALGKHMRIKAHVHQLQLRRIHSSRIQNREQVGGWRALIANFAANPVTRGPQTRGLQCHIGLLPGLPNQRNRNQRQPGIGPALQQDSRIDSRHLHLAGNQQLQIVRAASRVLNINGEPFLLKQPALLRNVHTNKRQIGLRLVAGHKSELHRRRCHLAASQQQKAARPQ